MNATQQHQPKCLMCSCNYIKLVLVFFHPAYIFSYSRRAFNKFNIYTTFREKSISLDHECHNEPKWKSGLALSGMFIWSALEWNCTTPHMHKLSNFVSCCWFCTPKCSHPISYRITGPEVSHPKAFFQRKKKTFLLCFKWLFQIILRTSKWLWLNELQFLLSKLAWLKWRTFHDVFVSVVEKKIFCKPRSTINQMILLPMHVILPLNAFIYSFG